MRKMRLIALLLLSLAGVLVLSAIVGGIGNAGVDAGAEVKSESVGKGLTEHAPIYIDGNDDFATQALSENWRGVGTPENPYMIENYDINASSANGIDIRNTDVHFVISDCMIHEGKSNYHNGTYFHNVTNGKIDNVTFYNNSWAGIYFSSSLNNQITNCVLRNNGDGINFRSSSNNTVINCTVYNNSYGIWCVSSSNGNAIINCNLSNNAYDGIYLWSSNNNTIKACFFLNNSYHGVYVNSCLYTTIIKCTLSYNGAGIQFDVASKNNIVSKCHISHNDMGLFLSGVSNTTLTNCVLYNNNHGIRFYDSLGNNIHYCNIYNNTLLGVYNYNSGSEYGVNATFCWWGSIDGPSGEGPGSGDYVTTNVLYEQWLIMPATQNNPPNALFTYSPNLPATNDVVHFVDLSYDIDLTDCIVSRSWQFGDGTNSTLPNPTHKYPQRGSYQVNLTVWDDDGASATYSTIITVFNSQPTLTNIIITPKTGAEDTEFTIRITYSDADGDTPLYINVIIDGMPYNMTYLSGDNATGALYEYKTKLSAGKHEYKFECDDGSGEVTSVASTTTEILTVKEKPIPYLIYLIIALIVLVIIAVSIAVWLKKKKPKPI